MLEKFENTTRLLRAVRDFIETELSAREEIAEQLRVLQSRLDETYESPTWDGFIQFIRVVDPRGIELSTHLRKCECATFDPQGAVLRVDCDDGIAANMLEFNKRHICSLFASYIDTTQTPRVVIRGSKNAV